MNAAIGIFAKAPVPGKTKTRLAQRIGDAKAAELHVAFLHDTLRSATKVTECVLFTAGDHEHPDLVASAKHFEVPRVQQEGANLGERMENALDMLMQTHETGVLIGSDAPTLPGRVLSAACVGGLCFGPSSDGGFYLVGASARPSFDGIGWSLSTTLEHTLRKNRGARLLEPWFDVDEWDDLQTLRLQLSLDPEAAPAAAAWLAANPNVR